MYIHGEVNKYGYRIIDNTTGDIIYQAGNNPRESSSVILSGGLPIHKLIEYCHQTGNEIAAEEGKLWVGIEEYRNNRY